MPVGPAVSYPGVYVQEVPSDVRTITPVDTATCALVGRALRGPVNQAVVVNGFADYQRLFGGLWNGSAMSFAAQDFFLNGGSKAVIVRLHKDAQKASIAISGSAPKRASKTKDASGSKSKEADESPTGDGGSGGATLTLEAKHEGAWGNRLLARIETLDEPEILASMAARYGVAADQLFNLIVHDPATGTTETFSNLTVLADSPREISGVLANESQLVSVSGTLPTQPPAAHPPVDPEIGDVWADTNAHSVAGGGGDGTELTETEVLGDQAAKTGIYALEHADIFNLLCIPPYKNDGSDVAINVWSEAAAYCEKRRAILLIDSPSDWRTKSKATQGYPIAGLSPSKNSAIFFPRVKKPNPIRGNQLEEFTPAATVAGVIARTDGQRGVWQAPAGLGASMRGVVELTVPLTDAENGELNPLGVNCLRSMPAAGNVVWGARTTEGDDRLASQWKYLPVRRTALFIEESLYRGTQWAVFEPNDEPLWAQLRLNIGSFMHGLYRQGAFQGQTPKEAYFVKCDSNTTPQADIDRGIVNVMIGFAPLKPAEFVVLYIQQIAGQIST